MKTRPTFPFCLSLISAVVLAGCASNNLPPEEAEHRAAATYLKEAQARSATDEQRAARYLASAAEALPLIDSPASGEAALIGNCFLRP